MAEITISQAKAMKMADDYLTVGEIDNTYPHEVFEAVTGDSYATALLYIEDDGKWTSLIPFIEQDISDVDEDAIVSVIEARINELNNQ